MQGGRPARRSPPASDSALWADAQAKADALVKAGKIDAARATELKAQARAALVEAVKPAYDDVIAWFRADTGQGRGQPDRRGQHAIPTARRTTPSA